MKNILLSVRPKWCEKICHETGKDKNGKPIYEKVIEVRKSKPSEVPFRVFIYCTKDNAREIVLLKDQYNNRFSFGDYRNDGDGFDIANCKVIGEFICDKIEDFYCASVPYQKENNLGYGQLVDNGIYKVNGWHEGIVFERNDRYIDTMLNNDDLEKMCLSAQELFDYIGVGKHLYAWHISDLKIYDKPRELSEFAIPCRVSCENCKTPLYYECRCEEKGVKYITRPPQSWCYVEVKNGK